MDQLWKQYRDTGDASKIGQNIGRPKKILADEKSHIIDEFFKKYKFGVRMLEVIIWKRYKLSISHNKIHQHLMGRGYAKSAAAKQRQRKWIRYERKHSMYAVHIDWHEDDESGLKICAVLDDSSRKILDIDEFGTVNTVNTIAVVERAV